MQKWEAKAAAVSMAGHDKGRYYLIIEEENGYYGLCDGRLRRLDHLKKKNGKHLQVIRSFSSDIKVQMKEISSDADVRRILSHIRRDVVFIAGNGENREL